MEAKKATWERHVCGRETVQRMQRQTTDSQRLSASGRAPQREIKEVNKKGTSDNITSGICFLLRPLWRRFCVHFCVHFFAYTFLRALFHNIRNYATCWTKTKPRTECKCWVERLLEDCWEQPSTYLQQEDKRLTVFKMEAPGY